MDLDSFFRLVESNAIPSQFELAHIGQIAALEEGIQSTLTLSVAPNDRELFHQSQIRLNACRIITSAVRRLPVDVLSEIFQRCVPAQHSDGGVPDPSLRELLPISHVCSLWRYAAIHTAQLWTSVSLEVTKSNYEHIFDPLAALWERTHVMPLSLSLQFSELPLSAYPGTRLTISPQSENIEVLDLRIPLSFVNPMLQSSKLTSLVRLSINLPSIYPEEKQLMEPIMLPDLSSNLRHFTFNAKHLLSLEIMYRLRIPWSQLTSIYIKGGGLSSSVAFCMLRMCSSLIICNLHIDDARDDFPRDIHADRKHITVLPALLKLQITGAMKHSEILDFYSFPALEDFKWTGSKKRPQDKSVLVSLQKRSQFNVLAFDFDLISEIMYDMGFSTWARMF